MGGKLPPIYLGEQREYRFAAQPPILIPLLLVVIWKIPATLTPILIPQIPLLHGLNWGILAAYSNPLDPAAPQGTY